MNKSNGILVGVVALVAIAGGVYYFKNSTPPPPPPIVQATPTPVATPENRYPVPADSLAALNKAAPPLNESDASLQEMLVGLFGKQLVDALFNPKEIIRRFVITVENAREADMPIDYLPFNILPGSFKTVKKDGHLYIDPKNDERYSLYRKLAEASDAKKIASIYFHFYPIIQSAYKEITSHGYFNDRLIQVIDQALATPSPKGPIEVVALNKSFKYADENLEKLSAIQKTFLRMGAENEKVVKEKLSALRSVLILGVN